MNNTKKRGRPQGSLAWGARLCATIAGRLVSQTDELAVTKAARAALDATYILARDKNNWRKGSDFDAVELVRQTFYRLQKKPHLAIQPSPSMILCAQTMLENQINELKQAKSISEASAQTAKTLQLQSEIEKLSVPAKQAKSFFESQKRNRTSLVVLARERGVKLSDEAITRINNQNLEAFKSSVKNNGNRPKPFATTKKQDK